MKLKIILLLSFIITSCSSEVTISEIALDLKKLENKNVISQSEDKDGILSILKPILWSNFEKSNLTFGKSNFEKTWSVYEDSKYVIVTGTVGRSKIDIEMFTILLKNGTLEFMEIGNDEIGKYPENIIPFSKL